MEYCQKGGERERGIKRGRCMVFDCPEEKADIAALQLLAKLELSRTFS